MYSMPSLWNILVISERRAPKLFESPPAMSPSIHQQLNYCVMTSLSSLILLTIPFCQLVLLCRYIFRTRDQIYRHPKPICSAREPDPQITEYIYVPNS